MPSEPDAESGSFQQISLSLLLIRALDQRWTGTLVVEPPFDMVHLIELDRGLVARVLVPDSYARLGELVVGAGVILESELELALQNEGLLGQALAEQRLIDARTLQKALVLQIIRRLVRLFDYPLDTEWTFVPDLDAFDGMPQGVRVDTLRVLWSGISTHGEMGDWQRKTLERIGESPFRLRHDVQLSRFGFTGDAARLVTIIDQERLTIPRLLEEKITPDDVCLSIVYLLAITRYLEFSPAGESVESMDPISSEASDGDEPTSSGEGDRPSQQPPQRVARIKLKRVGKRGSSEGAAEGGAREDDVLAEIKNRLARLEKESPFTLLDIDPADLEGLDEEAATERLWQAYERAARRWHPDNCPRELIELREGMGKLHRAITAAFETLAEHDSRERALRRARRDIADDPSSSGEREVVPGALEGEEPKGRQPRRRPARTLPSHREFADEGPAHAEQVTELTPTELHERAFVAMSEQRFTEALRLSQLACHGAPENPDYLASSIWIRACMPGADLKVVCLDLDDLLLHHAAHVQARYYRGVLRRRLGYDSAAKQDFERVLDLDPEHGGARHHLEELGRATRQNR